MKYSNIFALSILALIALPVFTCLPAGRVSAQVTLTNPLNSSDISSLLQNAVTVLNYVIGAISTVMFLVAAMMFLSSGGDPNKLGTAKKAFFYAIIGVIIVIAGNVIIETIRWIATGSTYTPPPS